MMNNNLVGEINSKASLSMSVSRQQGKSKYWKKNQFFFQKVIDRSLQKKDLDILHLSEEKLWKTVKLFEIHLLRSRGPLQQNHNIQQFFKSTWSELYWDKERVWNVRLLNYKPGISNWWPAEDQSNRIRCLQQLQINFRINTTRGLLIMARLFDFD